MAIKRYVQGQGWVEIANNSSSFGKAANISVSDFDEMYESDNVEGALSEIAADLKKIKKDLNEHQTNHPSGGGGPSTPGTGVLPTITSTFEITSSDGKSEIEIPIFFNSPNLGDGTCYILVKNIEVKTQPVSQGANTIIVPPIGAGKNIPIAIYVKDRAGMMSNQLTWSVTAGGITMEIRTRTQNDFSYKGIVSLSYMISCISTEDIYAHFIIKGYDYTNGVDVDKQVDLKSINGANTYQINTYDNKELGVGVYNFTYWADSGAYSTTKQSFSLVIVDENTLLVSTEFDTEAEYESGVPIRIPYRVSIDQNAYFTVELYIDGKLNKTLETKPAYLYWAITSLDVGTHTLQIKAYNNSLGVSGELEFQCKVIAGAYTRIQPVMDASLLCWFDATDRTNDDMDRDIWTDKICGNQGKLYNFNFGSNGWIKEEGSLYTSLKMDGISYVEIDMTPFEDNFKYGATIEIVFKTKDIGDMGARVLDITDTLAPYKGVYIDTREAYITSASRTIQTAIGEDEYIQVMFQIDRDNKFVHTIVNGVITQSNILGDSGSGANAYFEAFDHMQKIYLNSQKGEDHFGACSVKHLRIYDRTLSFEEILQNYLSTIEDLSTQKAKADFNDATKRIIPTMVLTVDEKLFDEMGSSTILHDVAMSYYSPNAELYGETITNATNCDLYWQGTSSMSYSIHNYNIVLMDENRQKIDYSPYPNCIPQSLFCLKANLMESTNAHNVGLADFVRRYLYTKNNPAMDIDPKASRTIQGFPILLYVNERFLGLYDFNLDRYSTKAFGYELPQHKNCKAYEIGANTNFTAGAFIPWTPDTGVDEWTWYKNDFKGIYPADIVNPINDDFAELKELVNFVYNSSDEVFKTNFDTYFDKESVIRYYIFVMIMGLVDSLGKNAKLVTYDGVKWYFEFYDMDTALGLNNTGALVKDVDIEMEIQHFNTAESKLWTRINEPNIFGEEIKQEYYKMRSTVLTEENLFECLITNQIEKIPEHQYNLSTQAKYLDDTTYISMNNGNRYYGIKRWIRERLLFCDTWLRYTPSTDKYVQIRSSRLGTVSFEIETFTPMYMKVRWRNQLDGSADEYVKIGRGERVKFTGTMYSNDQEIFLYCAPHIKQIAGMDIFAPNQLMLDEASRLIALECADCKELELVTISGCKNLQKIDFNGCSKLGTVANNTTINVEGCDNLKYLDAYGTALTGIDFNASGGNLVELNIPNTLTSLSLTNQYSLKRIGIPGATSIGATKLTEITKHASGLTSFSLINCPQVEDLNYSSTFSVSEAFFDNYANERKGAEIKKDLDYPQGEWQRLMQFTVGLANCHTIHIENSCCNIPGLGFRNMHVLKSLTLKEMQHLKTLLLGANCTGFRSVNADYLDIVTEFDWEKCITFDSEIEKVNIEEFRIHEMYPNNYNTGSGNNLTWFSFKPGTDVLNLAERFPKLKIFECNLPTQNIHQIILPKTLESIITCSWHDQHDGDYKNTMKLEKFNIDSVFFEGDHDSGYEGVDLGNKPLIESRVVAPYAKELVGVNITNQYVNPVFNTFKEFENADRPFVSPEGTKIDLSGFKGKQVSDWFAYIDFTQKQCEIIYPEDWDTFIKGVEKAERMFYYCKNPTVTWEFAMKFFPKISSTTTLGTMYQHAELAEQQDYETDGVDIINSYNIGSFSSAVPFAGSNLKYVKKFELTKSNCAYGTFAQAKKLKKVGECNFPGTTYSKSTMGISTLFQGCSSLEEVGVIRSANKAGSEVGIAADSVFAGCSSLIKIGELDITANSLDATYSGCLSLTEEGLALPDTSLVPNMNSTFLNCKSLTSITVPNMKNVISMTYMFQGCESLKTINLPSVGPDSPITNMQYAFAGCAKLTDINLDEDTLPIKLTNMTRLFQGCAELEKLPKLPDFTNNVDMSLCCDGCNKLTNDTMYKYIPAMVNNISSMYSNCAGLTVIDPPINVESTEVNAAKMFKGCPNLTSLKIKFTGGTLLDSRNFADSCTMLKSVEFTFPPSLLKNNDYDTGVTFYRMFYKCEALQDVKLDMTAIANTNTKADFGEMFSGCSNLQSITGLDFSCFKEPNSEWKSNKGGGTYDNHNPSITAGGNYSKLTTFGITGLLGFTYDFYDIRGIEWIKEILRHLDTVKSATLGTTYDLENVVENPDSDDIDPEILALVIGTDTNPGASRRGWSFTTL